MSATAYIGLGSNLGDRRDYLDRAVQALQALPGIEVVRVSSYRETVPVGGPPGQGNYLNAAAELRTDLEPAELLRVLLAVEKNLGRVRSEHHGPAHHRPRPAPLRATWSWTQLGLIRPAPADARAALRARAAGRKSRRAVHPVFDCTINDLLWKLRLNLAEEPAAGQAAPPAPTASARPLPRPGGRKAASRAGS